MKRNFWTKVENMFINRLPSMASDEGVDGNGNSALNWRMLIRWMQSKSSNSLTEPPRFTGESISAVNYYSTFLHQAEGQSRNAVLAFTTAGG